MRVLHDRRAHRSKGNIDHIAIAPTGLYVIDCKRYQGKIHVRRPLFGKPTLKINAWNRTKLIDGLDGQIAHVKAALGDTTVPVHGCLCFVAPEGFLADIGLPLGRTLKINGYLLYYPRRLAQALNKPEPLADDRAQALQTALAQRLPAAALADQPRAAA